MIYVDIPIPARIDNKSEVKTFYELQALLDKHGFAMTALGDNVVAFYDKRERKDNSVPMHSYYRMSRKEFLVIIDLVKRLEASEKKLRNVSAFMDNH